MSQTMVLSTNLVYRVNESDKVFYPRGTSFVESPLPVYSEVHLDRKKCPQSVLYRKLDVSSFFDK